MSFQEDIKNLRISHHLTQEALANRLHVSRQTVSTWENGKNYPNLDTLRMLSQFFDVSFEKLIFGEQDMKNDNVTLAEKVDQDLVKKGRYKKSTIVLVSIFIAVVLWISTLTFGYTKGVPLIDRFNPFLGYTTAYAKLPSDSDINPKNNNHGYWTAWFTDNPMGTNWSKLTLTTGMNPGAEDPYVMVYHKGSFVKVARIIPGKSVDPLSKSNISALEDLENNKDTKAFSADQEKLKKSIHLSMAIQNSDGN